MTLTFLDPQRVLVLAAALGLSILTGFALSIAPVLVAGGILGVLFLAMIVKRPELGALTILILVAIVPRGVLFERGIPLGGGNLKVTDLLLVATLGCWLVARTVDPARYSLPSRPTTLLILGFLLLAMVSVVTAHAMGTPRKLSLLELRPLLSYLLVFPLVSGIRSARDFRLGLGVVLAAASTSAVITIALYARGEGDLATFSEGAIRITDTVFVYQLLGLIWCGVVLAYSTSSKVRWALLLLMAVQMAGLFVTFQRGAWIAAIAAVPLVYLLLPSTRRHRLVARSVPLLVLAVAGILAVNSISERGVSDPLRAGFHRLISLGSYEDDVSSTYRIAEWSQAIEEIESHPISGIGLGSSITFVNPMYSPTYNENGFTFGTYYIHNSYLWFALKLGLVGALLFLLLIIRAFALAVRSYRTPRGPTLEAIPIGVIASLVALSILAASGPHFNDDNAAPATAVLIALVEATRHGFQQVRSRPDANAVAKAGSESRA